ncbi:carbamoyl phosphate synthase small subunit [Fusobacterium sp.]|uniref:carbamoyl phosphate synthase small subunit n=1 Tax=Fusobacterium sp. TaxID=68766 RepID=UPI0026290309|nr:carbamoyl phosphate synthase small subunit [Fusobacterium sp.]
MKGKLILENGKVFEGKIFGELTDAVGEISFNTSMTGYQEMLTDPAGHGLMTVMTYPMIGNYGINTEDMESDKVQLRALIIKEDAKLPNNFRCEMTLDGFLRQYNVTGFKGIDTRYLTQIIRDNGSMKAIITAEDLTKKEIQERFESFSNKNAVAEVSCKEKYEIKGGEKKIGVLDLGVKKSTLNYLEGQGFDVVVFPYNTKAEDILAENISALVVSNGPGNPEDLVETIEELKKLIGKLQIFGEVLGHQVLALALGGKVAKLKYGHRGGYPVRDMKTGKVVTTSQNTGYVVEELPEGLEVTYQGINVKTIEGMESKTLKVTGVQFMPDLYESPKDVFVNFLKFV